MKKITSAMLVLIMCISFIIPTSAAGTSFTIGGAAAEVGQLIDLPVIFTSDVKVRAIGLDLSKGYDTNVLEFIGFVNKANFNPAPIFNTFDETKKIISLGWLEAQNFSGGVKVCDIRFKVIGKGDIQLRENLLLKMRQERKMWSARRRKQA